MKKAIAFSAVLTALMGALAAYAAPSNQAHPVNIIPFGSAGNVLLDGGVQRSSWVPVAGAYTLAVACTGTDAGSNAALGSIALLGSIDASDAGAVVLGSALALPGNSGTVAWDPITTGMQFLGVQVDGGGTSAGTVYCTIFGKGSPPVIGQ